MTGDAKDQRAATKDRQYPYPVEFIEVRNSIKIAYLDEGSADHPVLIFLHGVGSGIPVWENNTADLKKDFRCIAIDLPGHGLSSSGDFSYTMQFYADVVLDFIKKLSLPNVTLIGHSLGGQVSLHLASKSSDTIRQIILLGPAGIEPYFLYERLMLSNSMCGITCAAMPLVHNDLNFLIGFKNNIKSASSLLEKLVFAESDAAQFAVMLNRSVHAMLWEPVHHLLGGITQRCLAMLGEKDLVSPYNYLRLQSYCDIASTQLSIIPNIIIERVKEGGHFLQYENSNHINRSIRNFLRTETCL